MIHFVPLSPDNDLEQSPVFWGISPMGNFHEPVARPQLTP
jgi:hypothetical protein